jgi:hypothetical protein
MSRLAGDFIDAQNIIIIDNIPHYSFKGNSYLEKLKNGLSLEFVFLMEDSSIQPEKKFEENVEKKYQYQPFKHELFAEEYDCEPFSMSRKGKNLIKKRCCKNMKKNKVKQNGYNDKLYNIEDNLPSIWEPDNVDDYYVNGDDSLDDYSYDFDNYSNYNDHYLEYWGINEQDYDSLYEWNNANHTGIGFD